ncbi:primase-helicase family protein, partial [Dyadobacter sp.]|uniref:primase-helicase family protein n=1 Tax=Dyadobacter sp. TaxID=1914288 RepID=UPI003F713FAD
MQEILTIEKPTELHFNKDKGAKAAGNQGDGNQKLEISIPDKLEEEKSNQKIKEKKIAQIQREYIRVGDNYLKEVWEPDKLGRRQKKYVPRLKSTIKDDFGANYLPYIKKYEGFVTVPSHVNYQSEIGGFFNKYNKLTHVPKPGAFPNISRVLNHIFEGYLDFIMDYMHLLYVKPTQRLPVLLLESQQRNTGKSTFGTLLKHIFQDNAIKVGNSDFESDFNSVWIDKLCVIVDETSLEKKGIMQMIKRLSTETSKVTSNEKGKIQTQIDFIGKFVFMSNEEGKALPIERGENRFAVFKIMTFKDRGITDDPNIEEKISAEIPAFLHHLANMKPTYPESGRMYFAPHVYHTKQLEVYFEGSRSNLAKAIQDMIADAFSIFTDQKVLHYSATDLMHQLRNGDYTKKFDRHYLKSVLEG